MGIQAHHKMGAPAWKGGLLLCLRYLRYLQYLPISSGSSKTRMRQGFACIFVASLKYHFVEPWVPFYRTLGTKSSNPEYQKFEPCYSRKACTKMSKGQLREEWRFESTILSKHPYNRFRIRSLIMPRRAGALTIFFSRLAWASLPSRSRMRAGCGRT